MRDAESWQRAKEIFDVAVDCRVEDRAAFVRDRCAGDDGLVADVESLLEADVACGAVFEQPVAPALRAEVLGAVAGVLSDRDHVLMTPGSPFGLYEITGFLGAGSMGEVYRARDRTLRRDVAIKLLPGQWTADSGHRSCFEREARLLAALNHPNIGASTELKTVQASAASFWSSWKAIRWPSASAPRPRAQPARVAFA